LIKKRIAAVLAVCILLCMNVCPVWAASATVTVGTVTANPGDTVRVPLSVSQISGIGAVGIYVKYDTSVLECVSAEAVGIMNDMDTNTANKEPVNRTGEIWLTGMCLKGINGSGTLMEMTFKVKEDAPEGLSPIDVVPDKPNQLILLDGSLMDADFARGGIAITTTPKPTTTAATTPTEAPSQTTETSAPANDPATPGTPDAPTTTAGQSVFTRPNGETVAIKEVTVVDVDGAVVTTPQGEPLMVPTVAIAVGEATATPGDRVTVDVTMSSVSELVVLGIDVSYDADALQFVTGEMLGFVKESMNAANITCNQEGVVVISCTDPVGVSGEGTVARLTFDVKRSAQSGEHRLELSPEPVLMTKSEAKLPMELFAGTVTVEGGGASPTTWVFITLGVLAAGGALASLAIVLIRKKKAVNPEPPSQQPPVGE